MYLKKILNIKKLFLDTQNIVWKKDIDQLFKNNKKKKELILILTIGRSGSRWLFNIFRSHGKEYEGGIERDVLYESFYHFTSYHKIQVDNKPFILNLKNRIIEDWSKAKTSVICSPYYVFNLDIILKELKPNKIILCLNDPFFTANSFYNKGFYSEKFFFSKKFNIMGLQPQYYFNLSHYFGRIVPTGSEFKKWYKLNRLGKIAWYMNKSINCVYNSLKKTKKKIYLFNLLNSDQNYDFYLRLNNKFKMKKKLSKGKFLSLKKKYAITKFSNDFKFNNFNQSFWTKKDKEQFLNNSKFYKNFYFKTNKYIKQIIKLDVTK